jgi:hypothetical protein
MLSHKHDLRNGMNKYWATLLLAITATQAIAGEKEYTLRICDEAATKLKDCNKCKEIENAKVSFKISKNNTSVMKNFTNISNNKSGNLVIKNCSIFNDDSFQCKESFSIKYTKMEIIDILTLTGDKWEAIRILDDTEPSYQCGYEIKNVFNFFK